MPMEAASREDVLRSNMSIAEETGFFEGETEWLENDLTFLIQSPLNVQLRAILGSSTAESFLHPTIKDQKKVKPDARFLLPKKQGTMDAHDLWNNLRANSRSKLMQSSFPKNYLRHGQQKTLENNLLRSIQFSRHRADLMHRVSQMNRNKTKELLKDFFLPSFHDDFSDLLHSQKSMRPLKSKDETRPIQDETHLNVVKGNDSKMKFVSEDECRCPGQFRERLEDLGISIKTGISLLDKEYKANSNFSIKRSSSEINASKKASKSAEDEAKDLYDRLNDILHESRRSDDNKETEMECRDNQLWEPLTMDALIQQGKKTIEVPQTEEWYIN